jgi:excisionase family DNA binding protein
MNSADLTATVDQKWPRNQSAEADPNVLLTIPEAAARLRISRSSMYRLFDTGELRWVRVCASRRVSTAELGRFIAEHTEAAP